MAKLIGTGKDPRFPEGQDYDVPENDLQHHVEAGLGVAVEPGTEAYAVHRGYDTIAADPGEAVGAPSVQSDYDPASRTSARIETTAFPGDALSPEDAIAKAAESVTEEEDAGDAREQPEDPDKESGEDGDAENGSAADGEPAGARGGSKSGASRRGSRSRTGDDTPDGPDGPGDGDGSGDDSED